MKLGVCYYPEHWPEQRWPQDAARMRGLGLTLVRVGEFAWSRLEPEPGEYRWDWLDRAIDVLAEADLRVVLGTPTATPPKWLIDRHPEILPVGADGRRRGFGSRRHYCFSSTVYRRESRRIVTALAQRYGRHPALYAWQTDNEYGCHDTVLSYSADAVAAFRRWLTHRYGSIAALNRAWGTVFWGKEYRHFGEIDPPVATVTEANPAHRLDYRRFASDQVVAFNRDQVEILRRHSPELPILHNFMGFFTEFDHHRLGQDLDAAGWDSYPLGFLDQAWFGEQDKQRFLRTGHPDFAAFHHDLYRGVGDGRFWVLEQQPGPVNWAAYNPVPLPGMVRLWSWEALAHGAEVVCYFRWRQAPFAQEQMHAGLNLVSGAPAPASAEVRRLSGELADLVAVRDSQPPAAAALLFDYPSAWLFDIQPQGADFDYRRLAFEFYSALRRLGVDVDILSAQGFAEAAAANRYPALFIPSLATAEAALTEGLAAYTGPLLIGPRSGSKTTDFQIPAELAPGPLRRLIDLSVQQVESLRPGVRVAVKHGNRPAGLIRWREQVVTDLAPEAVCEQDGWGALYRQGEVRYLAGWPEPDWLQNLCQSLLQAAGVSTQELPQGLRLRSLGDLSFAFNYGPDENHVPAPTNVPLLLGRRRLAAGELAAWRS